MPRAVTLGGQLRLVDAETLADRRVWKAACIGRRVIAISSRLSGCSGRPLLAGSTISLLLPKAVSGWFAAGTDGKVWEVTTIA